MKTLKTITTAVVLLITLSSFAQTKEETLEWLKQNGSSYLDYYYSHSGNQYFFYSYQFSEEYFEEKNETTESVRYYKKVYYKDIFTIEDIAALDTKKEQNRFTYVKIPIKKYEHKNDGEYSYSERIASRYSFGYDANQPNARKNIDKVLRALMHMAKLSGAEPYKDLFGE